jgi:hypothetical protein
MDSIGDPLTKCFPRTQESFNHCCLLQRIGERNVRQQKGNHSTIVADRWKKCLSTKGNHSTIVVSCKGSVKEMSLNKKGITQALLSSAKDR